MRCSWGTAAALLGIPILLWLVERTEPYLQLESASKEILNEIVHRLDALVATEGALESRLGRVPTSEHGRSLRSDF